MQKKLFSALFVLAAAMILAPFMDARGQDLDKPVLLVASPALQGDYRGTVLLAAPAADAHVGVILNRPSTATLASLFPDHEPSKEVTDPVRFGGPELNDTLFALVHGASPHPSALDMGTGLWLVAERTTIDAVIEATPNAARYFVGFVYWNPNELATEIEKGYFVARPVDASTVMRHDTSRMYDELGPKRGQVGA